VLEGEGAGPAGAALVAGGLHVASRLTYLGLERGHLQPQLLQHAVELRHLGRAGSRGPGPTQLASGPPEGAGALAFLLLVGQSDG
jgi:hypothetical protein